MTGHGRGISERGGRRVTVEVRSVNHRFFDLKVRSGPLEPAVEDRLQAAVRKRVERGSLTLSVREDVQGGAGALRVDLAAARAAQAAFEELRRELALAEPVTLALLAAQPGVLSTGEAAAEPEAVLSAVEAALEELSGMRRREGETLAKDLLARLARLGALAEEVGALAAAAPGEWQKRLGERLARLLGHATAAGVAPPPVDEARLAQEVALLADRMDITEELVRLRSHLAQARALIAEDAPVGRRLDFLVQELGREVNTIGSKAQSAEIARRVVEAKAELERVREQIQNVE